MTDPSLKEQRKLLKEHLKANRAASRKAWRGAHRPHMPHRTPRTGPRSNRSMAIIASVVTAALLLVLGGAGLWVIDHNNDIALNNLQTQIDKKDEASASTDTADQGQQEDEEATAEQARLDELEKANAELQAQIDELKKSAEVANASSRAPPLTQTETVDQAMAAAGFSANDYTYDINRDQAQAATSGAGRFGTYAYSGTEYAAFLASGSPEANASLSQFKQSGSYTDANLTDGNNWVAVQSLVATSWSGNTFFKDGAALPAGHDRMDPAGTVVLIYVGPETLARIAANGDVVNPDDILVSRGACKNPQTKMPTPTTPSTTTVTVTSKKVQRCDITTKANVTITEAQALDTTRFVPVGDQACKTVVVKNVERCDITTKTNVTISEEQAKDTNRYKPVGDDACKPVVVTPKCSDLESSDDGYCGTPNEGAEQQPVQDNDPALVAPTPGYTAGDAEQNAEEQGPPCTGAACGLDPTPSGTEVADSENGGVAPGGDVVTPEEQPAAGQPAANPDADGTTPTNPDAGTSSPDVTSVIDEAAPTGDVLADVELENVP